MKRIIITVGPSFFAKCNLVEIHKSSYIYRINCAHQKEKEVENSINKIRENLEDADILIDLPCNKIRTANLESPIRVYKERKFSLRNGQINYNRFHELISVGETVFADDSTLKFEVDKVCENEITFISKSEGTLLNNKGLHVRGINNSVPFLFEKDKNLIKIGNKNEVTYIGLSYVRTVRDINEAEELIDDGISIIAKIETRKALENLNEILERIDYILVDRGDLSTEIGLEKIPHYQRFVIEKALFFNKYVFLATQFMKNMIENPVPSIAEVVDIYNTFKLGAFGIQLSEETAIGAYPQECLEIIERMIEEINSERL